MFGIDTGLKLIRIMTLIVLVLILLTIFTSVKNARAAENGQLSSKKSEASARITVIIPPKIDSLQETTEGGITLQSNITPEEWDVEKRGNLYIFTPKL